MASPLLTLPPELRNRIYDYLFTASSALIFVPTLKSRGLLALSMTCSLFYNETRTLALPLIIHRVSSWHSKELEVKVRYVQPQNRHFIKKLWITADIHDFFDDAPFDGIDLAHAGLCGVEELVIRLADGPVHGSERHHIRSLAVVLWNTVANCQNDHLKKIYLIDGGMLCHHSARLYMAMRHVKKRLGNLDSSWEALYKDPEKLTREWGCCLSKKRSDGSRERDVFIFQEPRRSPVFWYEQ
jgi:hypothetical protein